jgi:copper resistance protein C
MKRFFSLMSVLLCGWALAHSELTSSAPTNGGVIKTMPAKVTLNFGESIESDFSTFKVYKYSGEVTRGQLRYFAKQQTALKNDAAARADAGMTTSGTTRTVELKLKPGLKPGVYVVMWKALSSDTHTSEDYSYFVYKP